MTALDLVQLPPLMNRGQGRPEVTIALIDGPLVSDLPEFAAVKIREIPGKLKGSCARTETVACAHGTLVAGMLAARRGSAAPAICPGCTLLVRPIFAEGANGNGDMPSATPEDLAEAIVDSVEAGAKIINLSAALVQPSPKGEHQLQQALDYAAQRGAITVAAAGNQGTVGSSAITRHPWVIPVAACDLQGRPLNGSNLGNSIGRRGLSAPGEQVGSLGTDGKPKSFGGTSAAAPFVTGAIALLWSEFGHARASEIRLAVMRCGRPPHKALVPPLLDAWAAYQVLDTAQPGSRTA
ncbi:MAG TPA: S8 family serine peptidase [Terriglobia bacterium]|nr:S8 family serine peptidase [Terriglobia bacterium]